MNERKFIYDSSKVYKCTDSGNAEMLADMLYKKYTRIPEYKTWFKNSNGKVYEEDISNEIVQDAITCIRIAQDEALKIADEDRRTRTIKWLLNSESQAKLTSAISLMSSISKMCTRLKKFDSNSMELNCQNGVVDLTSGNIRKHSEGDRFLKICNVNYSPLAKSPTFENFLKEICENDIGKALFLQKGFGYGTSGKITEEILIQIIGPGGNGKTKLIEAVKHALGNYCITASPDILMAKDVNSIPNDIARLQGARLVLMSEPDPGKKFSDNAVKSLTGGDTIIARFLHKEYFEFEMQALMVILTNHEIRAVGTDNGLWRRFIVVPLTYIVPEEKRDKNLNEKLRNDGEAVLKWLVDGCILWQKQGLKQTAELLKAKADYRKSQDAIGSFIEDCCSENPIYKIKGSDLYKTYVDWCDQNGEYSLNMRLFSSRLKEKGFTSKKSGVYYWHGITLTDNLEGTKDNWLNDAINQAETILGAAI